MGAARDSLPSAWGLLASTATSNSAHVHGRRQKAVFITLPVALLTIQAISLGIYPYLDQLQIEYDTAAQLICHCQ